MPYISNPTSEVSHFRYDGKEYEIVANGELTVSDEVALHYQRHINGPCKVNFDDPVRQREVESSKKEHTEPEVSVRSTLSDKKERTTDAYEKMSWAELRAQAREKGFYKVGMERTTVEKLLRDCEK